MSSKSQKLGRNPFDKKKPATQAKPKVAPIIEAPQKQETLSTYQEPTKTESIETISSSLRSWALNWLTVELPAEIIMTGIKITALAYSEFRSTSGKQRG